MINRLRFLARREYWGGRIELAIGDTRADQGGAIYSAHPITFSETGPHVEARPCLSLTPDEAQALVDELWLLGVRPSEGTGSAGSLAATERHLVDMRRVAFGALKRQGIEVDQS